MKVLRSFTVPSPVPILSELTSIIIGNFDGCHIGHQALFKIGIESGIKGAYASLCLTFDPSPKQFFQPGNSLGKLFQPQQKLRALAELGLDYVVIQEFNQAFSALSPDDFYKNLLHIDLHAKVIIVGHDFNFGHQRAGNLATLRALAHRYRTEVISVTPQSVDSILVSSSLVRQGLLNRNLGEVEKLLGRPYLLEGRVTHGKKLGRKLGFPTANLATEDQLLPGLGVYAGFAVIDEAPAIFKIAPTRFPCVVNIGKRPTANGQDELVQTEVHILSDQFADDSLYDLKVGVYLKEFIREEQRFPDFNSLINQISKDCQKASQILEKKPEI